MTKDSEILEQFAEEFGKISRKYERKVKDILRKYDDNDTHYHKFTSFRMYDSMWWIREASRIIERIEKEQVS